MTKKILFTGGNGFIARSLVEKLKNDDRYHVCSFNRESLDLLDARKVPDVIKEH